MTRRTLAWIALFCAAFAADRLPGQQGGQLWTHWDESKLSQPEYKAIVDENVQIPMQDGVKLTADIYRPDAQGRFPALVLRTPYNKRGPGEERDSRWLAERGYVVVNQDVRGRYLSGGEFYAYRNEAEDGYQTDEWVAGQP